MNIFKKFIKIFKKEKPHVVYGHFENKEFLKLVSTVEEKMKSDENNKNNEEDKDVKISK